MNKAVVSECIVSTYLNFPFSFTVIAIFERSKALLKNKRQMKISCKLHVKKSLFFRDFRTTVLTQNPVKATK